MVFQLLSTIFSVIPNGSKYELIAALANLAVKESTISIITFDDLYIM